MAVRGLDCTLYRNTGSYGSPTWNLVDTIKDNNVSYEKGKADASTRRTKFRENVSTLIELGIEFGIKRDRDNADWQAFYEASKPGGSPIEILLLDGPIEDLSGEEGLRLTAEVFGFGQAEELEGVVFNSVTMSPYAGAENPPEFYEVP